MPQRQRSCFKQRVYLRQLKAALSVEGQLVEPHLIGKPVAYREQTLYHPCFAFGEVYVKRLLTPRVAERQQETGQTRNVVGVHMRQQYHVHLAVPQLGCRQGYLRALAAVYKNGVTVLKIVA